MILLIIIGVASTKAQERCRTDISVYGFKKLSDLTNAIKNDFFEVETGAFIPKPHVYRLCPRTTFHLDENNDGEFFYIYPLLDGTQIICGSSGERSDNCIIKGGDIQVLLRESLDEEYVRKETEFRGITFESSNGLSVAAWDSPGTKATFVDCHWKKNTGKAVIQNIYVPYTKVPSPAVTPTNQNLDPDSDTGNETNKEHDENDRFLISLQDQDVKSNGLPRSTATITKSSNQNTISSSSANERIIAPKNRNLVSSSAMEIELIGCSISETFGDDEEFFSLINIGGTMIIKDSLFYMNQNSCNIISSGGSVSLEKAHFLNNNLLYNIAIYDGKLDVDECIFEMNEANTEIITVDDNETAVIGSEVSLQKSCFIQGNYEFTHVYLHPNSQMSTDENNFANNTNSGLCHIFYEDVLSSCFSTNNESLCIGACDQFDIQSCPTFITFDTQSPTMSPAPSYSSSTIVIQDVDDDYNISPENKTNEGGRDTNPQDSGEKSGFSPGIKEIIVGTLFVVFTVLLISTFVIYRRLFGREKDASDMNLFRQNSKII